MRFKAFSMLAIIAAAGLAGSADAHHSFAMFDGTKMVTWTGTVVDYKWSNPHTHITVAIPPSSPNKALVGNWDIEGASPNIMLRQGWTKSTFKPGDKITIVGHPLKDGTKGGSLYYAISPTGQRLYHDVNRTGGPAAG